jgi:hypothetical protein
MAQQTICILSKRVLPGVLGIGSSSRIENQAQAGMTKPKAETNAAATKDVTFWLALLVKDSRRRSTYSMRRKERDSQLARPQATMQLTFVSQSIPEA